MNTTTRILFTVIISLFIGISAFAGPGDSKDDFIKHTELRNGKNYFTIDLSTFENRFEKVYFVMKLYHYQEVVVVSSDPESKSFKFSSDESFPVTHIQTMVKGIRKDTMVKADGLTSEQQNHWLEANDKFRKE